MQREQYIVEQKLISDCKLINADTEINQPEVIGVTGHLSAH